MILHGGLFGVSERKTMLNLTEQFGAGNLKSLSHELDHPKRILSD